MRIERVVIVGASLAGATAAGTLREEGFQGDVYLVGAERQLPYHRPPLSKEYLRGEARNHEGFVHPARYYAEQRIELRLGVRAAGIDAASRRVILEDGDHLAYDRLLVATGGRNRALDTPGADLPGVFQLRTIEDCDRIRAVALPGRRAVIVGLGFIGCEVAASLRQMGLEVAAIDTHAGPLARVLGKEMAGVLAGVHRDHGLELVLEDGVAAFEGAGRVERVRTRKGRVLECDFVVAGIGIVPNGELVASAGGAVDDGVLVDEWCRTSLPGVYAAGDVARHLHPLFGRLRVEHWNNGRQQGQAAARIMLGGERPYDYVHSFWSNQYEHTIEYVGFAARWDRLVFRGPREGTRLLGFYVRDGVVAAAVGLDRGGDPEDPQQDGELKAAVELIRARVPVDPAALADERVGLRSLVPGSARAA